MYIAELLRICLQQESVYMFLKKKRIGALRWRTLMSQIRYSSEIVLKTSKGSGIDGTVHILALGCERELEPVQPLLERQRQLG